MADVTINIRQESGSTVTATGHVDDYFVAELATMLGAMLFDALSNPAPSVAEAFSSLGEESDSATNSVAEAPRAAGKPKP